MIYVDVKSCDYLIKTAYLIVFVTLKAFCLSKLEWVVININTRTYDATI